MRPGPGPGSGLVLLPALDVAGGRAVRPADLRVGATGGPDPAEVAARWQAAGARWLHMVDLDAAYGRGSNLAQLRAVIAGLDIPVQLSGGIRDAASLEAALSTGAERVNLATDALRSPEWVHEVVGRYGARVSVSLDVRGDRLRPRGMDGDVGPLFATLAELDAAGAARYVVTDVATDGALSGPNLDLLRAVCAATDRPVLASGGVADLADLAALRSLIIDGLEGVVLGTALAAEAFGLEDALAVADGRAP